MAYKLLKAAVIVDLRSTTKVVIQSCQKVPQDQDAALITVAQNEHSNRWPSSFVHTLHTSLTWRTTTHGGTTKVTTTGDRAKI